VEREAEIMALCQFDVYSDASIYETFDFLISLVKAKTQNEIKRLESIKYVRNIESMALSLIKASLLSVPNYSFSNIVRVASMV